VLGGFIFRIANFTNWRVNNGLLAQVVPALNPALQEQPDKELHSREGISIKKTKARHPSTSA
jgi:hypothetical protein